MPPISVLYVEDDDSQRDQFAELLRSRSFDVLAARSGAEGLELFRSKPVDVFLCDLNMPDMTGLEVLKEVLMINGRIPFIILTAHGSIQQAVTAMKQGAYDFVPKPLEIESMVTRIQNAVEKKRLEQELRESEARLDMILKEVPEIIYSMSPDGLFLSVNPAFETILGYRPDEVLGKPLWEYVVPEEVASCKKAFQVAQEQPDNVARTIGLNMLTCSGETRYLEVSARAVVEEGKIVGYHGIGRDVTQRIRMQEQLEQYSQGLEQMVKERTESLEYATRQLQALNDVSNRFTQIFDEDQLWDEVPKLLTKSLDFDRSNVILMTEEGLKLRSLCFAKDSPGFIQNFLDRINTPGFRVPDAFPESFKQNKTVFIPDLNKDPRWPKDPGELIRTKAVVVAPIRVENKPIGLLFGNMQHHTREMDSDDVLRFEMFASMVGLALENIRAYQSLEKKVLERTTSLRDANRELQEKASELMDAHQEILESKRQLQTIIDSSLNAIVVVDREGKVIAGNRKIGEFFCVDLEEILHKPIDVFMDKVRDCFKDQRQLEKHFEELKIDPEQNMRIDLSEIYARGMEIVKPVPRILSPATVSVLDRSDEVLGRVWAYFDITDLTKAQEALRESEARFRNLVENATEIILSLSPDGAFTYVSPNVRDILGFKTEDMVGRPFSEFVHPADIEGFERFIHEVSRSESRHGRHEYRIHHRDGTWRWYLTSASPVTDEKGQVLSIIGICQDITESKHVLDDLAQANRVLRETQGQLVQSEKMAALGMLVAGIAHEINTPVAAIYSMHDTLLKGLAKVKMHLREPESPREERQINTAWEIIEDANRVIENGCERVTNIVKRLRSFARLDEAELKRVDIHEGLEDTLTLIHHELKHNINIIKEYGDIPQIACYPGRLNQVFLNILVNAKQAIHGNGDIRIRTFMQDGRVHISIKDSGPGIPKEHVKKLFDPGFTTKGVGVGTGLGLSICYQIIEDHKGSIRVESEPGKGAEFIISLPADLENLLGNAVQAG